MAKRQKLKLPDDFLGTVQAFLQVRPAGKKSKLKDLPGPQYHKLWKGKIDCSRPVGDTPDGRSVVLDLDAKGRIIGIEIV